MAATSRQEQPHALREVVHVQGHEISSSPHANIIQGKHLLQDARRYATATIVQDVVRMRYAQMTILFKRKLFMTTAIRESDAAIALGVVDGGVLRRRLVQDLDPERFQGLFQYRNDGRLVVGLDDHAAVS